MEKTHSKAHITNFIRNIIEEDLQTGKHQQLVFRFPPEPNGYLHIGHAKAICVNFGFAGDYQDAVCHLRFDDTNPEKEEEEFIDAIKDDVKWLGFNWGHRLFHASSYFDQLYQFALHLIHNGHAYVCSLTNEQIREYRGTLTEPGRNSPYRDRSVAENLKLFEQMKSGIFKNGEHVLRAKIDMASGNVNMRDPIIYRVRHVHHPMLKDKWKIYPMYDYTHCISDALEGITHSLCTLEFEDHRPLYDWFLDHLPVACHPRQIEFARLELNYTVTSKRKLKYLVEEGIVSGWDDPRLPTIRGIRRRGFPPKAIRAFCDQIGLSKKKTIIDMGILEECVREELNGTAIRVMGVLNPLKVTLLNFPQETISLTVSNHPQDDSMGSRSVSFSSELFIDRDDFMENPPPQYFRLSPGKEVRLRYGYVIKCEEVLKDDKGEVVELKCSVDLDTLGKKPEGRKVKGIIHWVSAQDALPVEVRLYDRLFTVENPLQEENRGQDFKDLLNVDSLVTIKGAWIESGITQFPPDQSFQFERVGYFCQDSVDSRDDRRVFNKIVSLKDGFQK